MQEEEILNLYIQLHISNAFLEVFFFLNRPVHSFSAHFSHTERQCLTMNIAKTIKETHCGIVFSSIGLG